MPKTITDIAKAALYRLTDLGLPPTPENYAKYYAEIQGEKPDPVLAHIVDPVPRVDVKLMEELVELLDSVSAKTAFLTDDLGKHHQEMKATVGDLSRTEEKGLMLKLLGSILNTSDAILTTTSETHDGLLITRQSLEQIRAELMETRRLVQEDALTGTLNRRGMEAVLTREIARTKRVKGNLTIAMIDIDHFKKINDRFGHEAGDQALVHLASLLRAVVREADAVVRYGGEEFVLIFPDTAVTGCRFILDRLKELLEKTPLVYEGNELKLAFSGGIAQLKSNENCQVLVMRADSALYEAKRSGRNRIFVAEA
ncbi:MAG: GGDEF domain-containing protein [Burkholderiales bacterium]